MLNKNKISTNRLIIIIAGVIMLFSLLTLAKSCNQSSTISRSNIKIDSLKSEIQFLQRKVDYFSEDLLLFESDIYKYLFYNESISNKDEVIKRLNEKINLMNDSSKKK